MSQTRCGTSWQNAESTCGQACTVWSDCGANTVCFANLTNDACLSNPQPTASSSLPPSVSPPPGAYYPPWAPYPPPGYPQGFPYPPGFLSGDPAPAGWAPGYPWPPPPPTYQWPIPGTSPYYQKPKSSATSTASSNWNEFSKDHPTPSYSSSSSSSSATVVLGLVIGVSLLAFAAVMGVIYVRRRVSLKEEKEREARVLAETSMLQRQRAMDVSRKILDDSDLEEDEDGCGLGDEVEGEDYLTDASLQAVRYGEMPTSEFIIAALTAAKSGMGISNGVGGKMDV